MSGPGTLERPGKIEQKRAAELTELGLAFKRVFRTLSRLRGRDTHLTRGEISHAQFELLIELQERGALSAGELASAARLAPGTVTQMLDGLAESGHVERARSDSDRRVVVSRLTPLGQAQIEAKRMAWQARWEQALGDLSDRELRAARKVLERLGEMFEDTPVSQSCDAPSLDASAAGKSA
jgi:DNA-binding MarR family transcriptional regulator